jgi:hypothetical protein
MLFGSPTAIIDCRRQLGHLRLSASLAHHQEILLCFIHLVEVCMASPSCASTLDMEISFGGSWVANMLTIFGIGLNHFAPFTPYGYIPPADQFTPYAHVPPVDLPLLQFDRCFQICTEVV